MVKLYPNKIQIKLFLLLTMNRKVQLHKAKLVLISPKTESTPNFIKNWIKNRNKDLITQLFVDKEEDITTVDSKRTLEIILRIFRSFISLGA